MPPWSRRRTRDRSDDVLDKAAGVALEPRVDLRRRSGGVVPEARRPRLGPVDGGGGVDEGWAEAQRGIGPDGRGAPDLGWTEAEQGVVPDGGGAPDLGILAAVPAGEDGGRDLRRELGVRRGARGAEEGDDLVARGARGAGGEEGEHGVEGDRRDGEVGGGRSLVEASEVAEEEHAERHLVPHGVARHGLVSDRSRIGGEWRIAVGVSQIWSSMILRWVKY